LSSSAFIQFDKIGFSSMTHSGFFAKSGVEAGSGVDFCLTGDCDALGIDNGKIAVMSVSQIEGVSLLRVSASDLVDFTTKKASSRRVLSQILRPLHSPHTSITRLQPYSTARTLLALLIFVALFRPSAHRHRL
jgi:hypothetical protein